MKRSRFIYILHAFQHPRLQCKLLQSLCIDGIHDIRATCIRVECWNGVAIEPPHRENTATFHSSYESWFLDIYGNFRLDSCLYRNSNTSRSQFFFPRLPANFVQENSWNFQILFMQHFSQKSSLLPDSVIFSFQFHQKLPLTAISTHKVQFEGAWPYLRVQLIQNFQWWSI